MRCPYCRTDNPDDQERCSRCGSRMEPLPPPPPVMAAAPAGPLNMVQATWRTETVDIPSYLLRSILVTLFCCLPLGIAAIVSAAKVNGYVTCGNYAAARIASDKARKWCWIGFGVFAVPILLTIWLWVMGFTVLGAKCPRASGQRYSCFYGVDLGAPR